jgi:hypothetical protein
MVTAVAAMVTAVAAMTMTGERRHWKQRGSRYRANERELAKHDFLRGQPAILYP